MVTAINAILFYCVEKFMLYAMAGRVYQSLPWLRPSTRSCFIVLRNLCCMPWLVGFINHCHGYGHQRDLLIGCILRPGGRLYLHRHTESQVLAEVQISGWGDLNRHFTYLTWEIERCWQQIFCYHCSLSNLIEHEPVVVFLSGCMLDRH